MYIRETGGVRFRHLERRDRKGHEPARGKGHRGAEDGPCTG